MSYKLEKPYAEKQKVDFIVLHNHQNGRQIEEGVNGDLFALEANEILGPDGEPVINPDYEAEQAQKEAERIAMLNLTAADVERAIYKAKGMDFEDILAAVAANPPEELDLKALKIELKANNFYRGNPYIEQVGGLLGFTSRQLDEFFKTNDYTKLLANEENSESVEEEKENDDIIE